MYQILYILPPARLFSVFHHYKQFQQTSFYTSTWFLNPSYYYCLKINGQKWNCQIKVSCYILSNHPPAFLTGLTFIPFLCSSSEFPLTILVSNLMHVYFSLSCFHRKIFCNYHKNCNSRYRICSNIMIFFSLNMCNELI